MEERITHKLEFMDVFLRYVSAQKKDDDLLALEDLSFYVDAGESIALIGPSGCGKSSTLQLAAGLLEPTSGDVLIDGSTVTGPRQKTALILQDFGLLPWKTVLANAELGLKIRGLSKQDRQKRALEAIDLVGLSDFAYAYPGELSGGMQQRLALARSLALDVDLLLMDEPLSALDALLRERLQDSLLELWQSEGYAQVLVTHSIDEAVFLGQRILVMAPRPGRLVGIIDNPHMGEPAFRGSMEFLSKSNEVRSLLREAVVAGDDHES